MSTKLVMPPEGTTDGYRTRDGSMWLPCSPEPDQKPGIAVCKYPGNYVNPAIYELVAVFESVEDRDFVLKLHSDFVRGSNG